MDKEAMKLQEYEYTPIITEKERATILKALRQARERTPSTGVSPADWQEKDQIDSAKATIEESKYHDGSGSNR